MDFRTELFPKPSNWKLNLSDPVLTLGSCFAQGMGERFLLNKFKVQVNPFGTTYHPFAIHKLLKYVATKEYPSGETFLERDSFSYNFDFHSSFAGATKPELEKIIHEKIDSIHTFVKSCSVVILTYGTAWVYERADSGEAVANCHKIKASHFKKRLATVGEISSSLTSTLKALRSINPDVRIILTVSPVRHLKDTIPLNAVSKSTLILACYEICTQHAEVTYFPAYEIMLDDLRDYRFFAEDLIHPTSQAQDYIWEKFSESFFSDLALSHLKKWNEVRKSLQHKPFQADHPLHQNFLRDILAGLDELKTVIDVEKEIKELKRQIK